MPKPAWYFPYHKETRLQTYSGGGRLVIYLWRIAPVALGT